MTNEAFYTCLQETVKYSLNNYDETPNPFLLSLTGPYLRSASDLHDAAVKGFVLYKNGNTVDSNKVDNATLANALKVGHLSNGRALNVNEYLMGCYLHMLIKNRPGYDGALKEAAAFITKYSKPDVFCSELKIILCQGGAKW